MPEYRRVVVPVLRWLNSIPECKAINIHGNIYTERGTPDILGCYRGRMFALEAKRPVDGGIPEEPRPDQRLRLRQWGIAGARTGVVRSLEDAQRIFKEEILGGNDE